MFLQHLEWHHVHTITRSPVISPLMKMFSQGIFATLHSVGLKGWLMNTWRDDFFSVLNEKSLIKWRNQTSKLELWYLRLWQSQEPWQIPLSKSTGSAQSEPENQSLQGIQKIQHDIRWCCCMFNTFQYIYISNCKFLRHRDIFWASARDEMPEGPQGEALVITKCGDVDWPGCMDIAVDIMISSNHWKICQTSIWKNVRRSIFTILFKCQLGWAIFGCTVQPGLFSEIAGKRLLFDGGLSKGNRSVHFHQLPPTIRSCIPHHNYQHIT